MAESNLRGRYYDSARAELIARLSLRDQALFVYVGVVGAYLAYAIGRHFPLVGDEAPDSKTGELLLNLPLPIICLTFSLIVLQHHLVIGELSQYVSKELLGTRGTDSVPKDWDGSPDLPSKMPAFQVMRLFAQWLVLSLPIGYSFYYLSRNVSAFLSSDTILAHAIAIMDFVALVGISWLHIWVHKERLQMSGAK